MPSIEVDFNNCDQERKSAPEHYWRDTVLKWIAGHVAERAGGRIDLLVISTRSMASWNIPTRSVYGSHGSRLTICAIRRWSRPESRSGVITIALIGLIRSLKENRQAGAHRT